MDGKTVKYCNTRFKMTDELLLPPIKSSPDRLDPTKIAELTDFGKTSAIKLL
jgi:hypothetical protein